MMFTVVPLVKEVKIKSYLKIEIPERPGYGSKDTTTDELLVTEEWVRKGEEEYKTQWFWNKCRNEEENLGTK